MKKRIFTEEEARERKNQRQKEYSKRTNYASQKKYIQSHTVDGKIINFRVSASKDSDIIEFLDSLPNKATYLKDLIRADINKKI